MSNHHLIITGTGRAGTTLLVQLLTELGLDTGFDGPHDGLFPNCDAGLETDLRGPDLAYVLKSPHFCDYLEEVLQQGLIIDRAIVPMRDLYAAAQSRREVFRRTDSAHYPTQMPGGLWDTEPHTPEMQEAVLANKFYRLIHALTMHDIPLTLLDFPRFVHEPDYLYRKLQCVLGDIGREQFLRAFQAVCRPEMVHDFPSLGKRGV